jgi:NADH-quinone oxidoreductase subunit L
VTHGFFKALLFLGAGSVIHACHHEQNIYRMGGLRLRMPITFATFTIGFLALVGMPGLAGFFSKDAILYLAWENNRVVFLILAATALLTAFYMTRLWLAAFFGEAKTDASRDASENDWLMTGPLVVLAIFSVLAGYGFMHPAIFDGILREVPHAEGAAFAWVAGISVVVLVAGFLAAWLYYGAGAREDRLEKQYPGIHGFLASKFFFDDVYEWYVSHVQQRFASVLNFIDHIVISGVIVRGAAGLVGLLSLGTRAAHTGNLHAYVYWIFLGVVLLWLFVRGVL